MTTPVAPLPRRAWVEQLMGMPISIHLRGDLDAADSAVARAYDTFREVDRVFSTYRDDSEVCRIRRGELALADASAQVRQVAALCEQARDLTQGAFDGWLPASGEPDAPRLFEPTGLVKGWAVQRVAVDLASELPDTDVLVNAGGDIAVHCNRNDSPDWHLAVENPLHPGEVIADIAMRQGGLATSGTAIRGLHILDPATGASAQSLASVSVAGPSLLWADVYATAAFVKGQHAGAWLSTLDIHTWMTVAPDGSTAVGTGRPKS